MPINGVKKMTILVIKFAILPVNDEKVAAAALLDHKIKVVPWIERRER